MIKFLLVLFLFFLTVTAVYADVNGYYVPITQAPQSAKSTQQMGSLHFIYITYTPTPPPTSGSGGTGISGDNAIVALATRTINTLRSSCGGYVSQRNISCINAVTPQNVADRLKLNVSEDYTLQCAGFTQAIGIGINAPMGDGNASAYVGRNIPGYQWIPNSPSAIMVPGDTVVWSGAGCQHIAVVTQVYGAYAFTVAEANGNNGSVDFMQYGRNSFCSLQGWQHKV